MTKLLLSIAMLGLMVWLRRRGHTGWLTRDEIKCLRFASPTSNTSMTNKLCGCADFQCPVHVGKSVCPNIATETLYRVDMADVDLLGTPFCDDCADDAWESGVFTTDKEGV